MATLYDDNYYKDVEKDIEELRKEYPFTKIVAYPYAKPTKIELKVIAVNNRIIRECKAQADDFKGEFSKEIKVVVPFDYKNRGCDIYGGSWFDIDRQLPAIFIHLYEKNIPLCCHNGYSL